MTRKNLEFQNICLLIKLYINMNTKRYFCTAILIPFLMNSFNYNNVQSKNKNQKKIKTILSDFDL